MKIKNLEVQELETDDVIASYTHSFGNTMQIVISSFDSDFFQLINENVRILRYRGENTDRITKLSIKESIIKNADLLGNNYKLIKLDDRAKMPFSIDELRYEYSGITTTEVLKGIGLR